MKGATRPRPRAGFTLAELALALGIGAILVGALGVVARTSVGAFEQGVAASALEQRSAAVQAELVRELAAIGLGSLNPDPVVGLGSSEITYVHVTGFDGRDPIRTAPRILRLELEEGEIANGIDDDGDGLIDECMLVLITDVGLPTERRRILTRGVAALLEGETVNGLDDNGNGLVDEPGFVVERIGRNLEVQLTLVRAVRRGPPVILTTRMSILMRNP